MKFGEKARARRLELGISQKELAESVGMTPSMLNHLEHGRMKRGPAGETLAKLAARLRAPDLLTV